MPPTWAWTCARTVVCGCGRCGADSDGGPSPVVVVAVMESSGSRWSGVDGRRQAAVGASRHPGSVWRSERWTQTIMQATGTGAAGRGQRRHSTHVCAQVRWWMWVWSSASPARPRSERAWATARDVGSGVASSWTVGVREVAGSQGHTHIGTSGRAPGVRRDGYPTDGKLGPSTLR